MLALPLGLADPIDVPPVGEALVEGHVVFTTIDAYPPEFDAFATQAASARRAAAGPLLEPEDVQLRYDRFAGVLWFNDQYVVPPTIDGSEGLGSGTVMRSNYGAAMAVLVRGDDGTRVREPCGGAIIAVNAGDPIPHSAILSIGDGDGEPDEMAWVGVDGTTVYSDGVVTATAGALVGDTGLLGYDYVESYRVKDPDDRLFVIDKYVGIVRMPDDEFAHGYPFWVANLYGTESFVPDVETVSIGGIGTGNCEGVFALGAASDQILLGGPHQTLCGSDVEGLVGLTPSGWLDDPCMSYQEPTRKGDCYGGAPYNITTWCDHDLAPLRRYQNVLYFDWDDVIPEPAVDHCSWNPELNSGAGGCDPAYAEDTTGCQSGTEWPCPGEEPWIGMPGGDDREGNSHTAHPTVPPHLETEPCPVPAPNPVNHGGSMGGRNGLCDYDHAIARIEVWYSATGRPAAPLVRYFAIDDLVGSSQEFFNHHEAYPGSP